MHFSPLFDPHCKPEVQRPTIGLFFVSLVILGKKKFLLIFKRWGDSNKMSCSLGMSKNLLRDNWVMLCPLQPLVIGHVLFKAPTFLSHLFSCQACLLEAVKLVTLSLCCFPKFLFPNEKLQIKKDFFFLFIDSREGEEKY